MKFSFARTPARNIVQNIARTVALAAAAVLAVLPAAAQKHDLPPPPSQAPAATSAQDRQPGGQVIFSRSIDENGQSVTGNGPAAPQPGGQMASAPTATDAERRAVTFTDYDMDVHLHAAEHQIAVRALVTVRNDGKTPLPLIPLQISSSLTWDRIRVGFHDVSFPVATLNSDADHTGQLHEAAVPLAQPLAPGASVQLDVTYSGMIAPDAQRLLTIGTPSDVALHSDWDEIGVDFTGLRGFGNVVWYPVSSVPVLLGDGATLFNEMGEHKLRISGAHFRLRLMDEFPNGHAPTVALINGHLAPLTVTGGSNEVPGVATADLDGSTLGFEAPSLFVAVRKPTQATNTTIWTLPADRDAVPDWAAAASAVTPFLQGWLGERPRSQLVILDLPSPEDMPFETGAMLATAVRQVSPDELDDIMAHALTHAWMQSPRAWLSEGVAHFMGTLWLEKQSGREKALESLEAFRPALAIAEPSSPGESPGQPLAEAISPIYYRTKAAYVFWMLRGLAGDAALSAALRAYNPADDVSHGYSHDSGSGSFEKLLEQASSRRNLSWFFADWVDADKGLPDLSIDSVFPEAAQAGNWLVAVNISNSGYASAEVPVTVSTANTSVTQRVLVPGRGKVTPRILIQGKPIKVQVNDGAVPETEASIHIVHLDNTGNGSSSSGQSAGVLQ
jgi:hypothetical protein